jgi:hypothetical protein
MGLETLPPPLQQLVQRELHPEEKLRWVGRPSAVRFLFGSLGVAVVGVVFVGFALFWMSGAFSMRDQHRDTPWGNDFMTQAFPYFGLIFVGAGVLMVLSPLWALFRASSTVYVVTDQRAILFDRGLLGTQIRSFGPTAVEDLTRRERSDGSGDLIFKRKTYYQPGHWSGSGNTRHYYPGGSRTHEIGFFGIPDVRHVERLLRDLGVRES